ncbi:MAG: 50S ribosomal protein L23 [Bacteroidetes bacterium RIFCSPLOWO2_12_FULL_31_6]|nr:MAG: 50S ribosomal protein L23 [Bacteroidetes bacterium RIFCSPLOWO2_12_FULL_31_6]
MKNIILKPVVTEKATALSEKLGKYSFVVEKSSNKLEVKDAVEKMYNVTVESVNTMNFLGKNKSRNTKKGLVTGRKNSYKKALITLKKGETIDFYSNI